MNFWRPCESEKGIVGITKMAAKWPGSLCTKASFNLRIN